MKKTDRFEPLRQCVQALDDAQNAGSPLQIGRAREAALIAGLKAFAQACGKTIKDPLRIDARGELDFTIANDWPRNPVVQGYGIEIAAWLGTIAHRTGMLPVTSGVLPENNWTRLNHFDAERLLRKVAANPERTIYVPSLSEPSDDCRECMPPAFEFRVEWVLEAGAGARPIYKLEPGQAPKLAIDEMMPLAAGMSSALHSHLQKLPRTPELQALLDATPWPTEPSLDFAISELTP